jgi:NAD(P)-dependent dehydrogenase (short-subunit alcohol dehydrogenase family)/malonyl CoA-acyl carrier protein transacylase/acyl carrier protein
MALVPVGAQDCRRLLGDRHDVLGVAAMNGPTSTVVSGDAGAVAAFTDELIEAGVGAKLMAVDYASHSPHMEIIKDDFERGLSAISPKPGDVDMYSTVTCGRVQTDSLDGSYWYSSLRFPVRFEETIRLLAGDGFRTFIEVSPHPILTVDMQNILEDAIAPGGTATVATSLRRNRGGWSQFLGEVAKAHTAGVPVAWDRCFPHRTGQHVDLPTYAFQRKPYRLALGGRIVPRFTGPAAGPDGDIAAEGPVFSGDGDLFRVGWVPAPATGDVPVPDGIALVGGAAAMLGGGTGASYAALDAVLDAMTVMPAVPRVVVVTCPLPGDQAADPAAGARAAAGWALETVQRWLSASVMDPSRLVVVTRGAVACDGDEPVDCLPAASIWGLIRSAQVEHPGRFTLLDLDDSDATTDVILDALNSREPQLAIRAGVVRVPRLGPARVPASGTVDPPRPDPEGTFLITGGTGSLGTQLARHVVAIHGAKHLLLVSRRGREAEGAEELAAELSQLGAAITFAACDVSDANAVRTLIAGIPPEHPLTGVLHTAGALDNCTVRSMTPSHLDAVFGSKVMAAWNLYEATRELNLATFVLFSSAAGIFGYPGQANYAAANVFLDSMAQWLRCRGVRAVSLAWGMWDAPSGLIQLSESDQARVSRNEASLPLGSSRALILFDRACRFGEASLMPIRLDAESLRGQAANGTLRPIFRTVISDLGAGDDGQDRQAQSISELVRSQTAIVLDYGSPDGIEKERSFKELGFDSLASLELRNRLSVATGLKLPATLITDYPTVADLTAMLEARLPESN